VKEKSTIYAFFSKSKHKNLKSLVKKSGRQRCSGAFNCSVKGLRVHGATALLALYVLTAQTKITLHLPSMCNIYLPKSDFSSVFGMQYFKYKAQKFNVFQYSMH